MKRAKDLRLRVLKAVDAAPHRYRARRLVSQSISLAILVLVPLLGVAQVDLWRGNHYLLFQRAAFKPALAGVIVGIAALYVFTFLSNIVAGRLFCGWGCPVAQVSRFGERCDSSGLSRLGRLRASIEGAAFSGLFVASVFTWWADPRVLVFGGAKEMAIAWGVLAVGTAGAFAHGRWWRWEFCKQACPIGVYYSFIAPAKYFGVHFRNENRTCIECDACDRVCPVDLTPRDLVAGVTDRGGISLGDAPGHNHCIECGDCIAACERMVTLKSKGAPVVAPLHLGWFRGDQRGVQPPASTPHSSNADRPAPRDPALADSEAIENHETAEIGATKR